MVVQFVQFGLVGVLGLAAELAVFYALRHTAGLLAAGLAGYAASATLTWWTNRNWTFQATSAGGTRRSQWARYALANAPGFALNRTVFFGLVSVLAVCARYPFLAAGAGSLTGLVSNYSFSRTLVFVGAERRKKGLLF